jgi:hypothetical protein
MSACKFNVNSSDHCHGCEGELRERLVTLENWVRSFLKVDEDRFEEIMAAVRITLARNGGNPTLDLHTALGEAIKASYDEGYNQGAQTASAQ